MFRPEAALINFNKIRIANADHPLRIYKAVHVNCDPAAIHEHEVRVADQPEMARPESLDEELFRMPSKTEHFVMTRPEFLLVHCRRLIRACYVRLARARTRTRFILVYVRSATFNFCLSAYVCARFRFCLRFALLLRGDIFFPFAGAVVCVSFVCPCVCCGSAFWPNAMSGNPNITVNVSILIIPSFLL